MIVRSYSVEGQANRSDEHSLFYSDEISKSIEHDSLSFQSTRLKASTESTSENGDHQSVSPISSTSTAASPPSPPKRKLISVKVRQTPTINEVHCFNVTNNKPSSPTQQTPVINA
ncbi:unnamed protein product [Rotaria sordida]|uniref:Uncharacterized protein n=1 Tax=Rotaria sordida TaxID=392033 RepID=A0A815J4H3_9BILA|nr:unnamed protein product [Rotaria sordida]